MFLIPESIKQIGKISASYDYGRIFLDIQVQITPYHVALSGRNSNSSKILCMSSIPTNSKWIGLIQRGKMVT